MAFRRRWDSPKFLQALRSCYADISAQNAHLDRTALGVCSASVRHWSSKTTVDKHHGLMENVRAVFQSAGVATSVGILHAIRKQYPEHVVVQTSRRTGLLDFAEAGFAKASLDTDSEFYASRHYNFRTDGDEQAGLKDKVELAKYLYEWKGDQYILYAAHCRVGLNDEVNNHYILGPQADAGCVGGRSTAIDELITAAALHGNRINDEIWVYDRGYWRKNRKLWANVQACKWDQVILDDEMKGNLVIDVEGFFDRKEDYTAFGVPWKVRWWLP